MDFALNTRKLEMRLFSLSFKRFQKWHLKPETIPIFDIAG
jgi:hypothetical protein